MGRLAREKRSSSFGLFVSNEQNKFLQQRLQVGVLDDGSTMDSTDSLMPTLPEDLSDEISNDMMQSILSNSRQGASIDGALTWL